MTVALAAAASVLGLCVGSFLNVVIHRVPQGLSVVSPPSACPGCARSIAPRDNVPVVSWIVLRGRCRHCATPISARYPFVEALTAVLFGVCALRVGPDAVLAPVLVLVAAGVALAAIDLDLHRLPFPITVPLFGASVVLLAVVAVVDGPEPAPVALASGALWGGLFFVLHAGTGGRGMGFGDVVLAPSCGLVLGWLGWGPSVVGLFAGFALGAVVGLVQRLRGAVGRGAQIPYGPFLLGGALLGVLVGDPIWDAYVSTIRG